MQIKSFLRNAVLGLAVLAGAALVIQSSGCYSHSVSFNAAHLPARIVADTNSTRTIDLLKVSLPTPPAAWQKAPLKHTSMYSQEEWYGPSHHTGLGVVYVHMPLPMPTGTLVWLAKQQYAKHQDGGQMTKQWTDDAGRNWFEAVSKTYHATGYVIADGTDAWIAYCGYRTQFARQDDELALAQHSMDALRPTK